MTDIFEDTSWVLPYRSPWATTIFYILTQFGNLEVLIALLPATYWLLRKRYFTRFILLLLFTVTFDGLLKDALQDPRPDPANIIGDRLIGSYSFPSDHVALATAYWSFLAYELQRWWVTVGAIAIVIAVGASRLYMGMHDLDDVPPSVALGWLFAFAFRAVATSALLAGNAALRTGVSVAVIAMPLVVLAVITEVMRIEYAVAASAFLVGWAAGEIWDRDIFAFKPHPNACVALAAAIIGLVLTFIIVAISHKALTVVVSNNTLTLAVELMLVVLFASLVTPPVFRALRLAV